MNEEIDNVEFYSNVFEPKVQEFIGLCNSKRIPCFMAFGIKKNDDGSIDIATATNVKSETQPMSAFAILPEIIDIQTSDTRFAGFVNVVNGFSTSLNPKDEFSVDELSLPD